MRQTDLKLSSKDRRALDDCRSKGLRRDYEYVRSGTCNVFVAVMFRH
jgi:hypothetical protein